MTLAQPLPVGSGGTNSTATATAGGVGYGTGTAHAYTSAGSSGQILQSNGASAPSWVAAPSSGLTLGTPVNSTSGTSITFTGIPAGVKQIIVSLFSVSTDGSAAKRIQLGTSGGIETADYFSTGARIANTAVTAGFNINSTGSGNALQGSVIITLLDASNNTWAATGSFADISASNIIYLTSGTKSLSGVCNSVRITNAGADSFDAGTINIAYM